jgi:hypothetical protein
LGGSSDVRILYNGVLFSHVHTSGKVFQQTLKPNRKFFPKPEYSSVNTANSKALSKNRRPFSIHKFSISKVLSFDRSRFTNTGTTVAIIMLVLWVRVYEYELVYNR